MIARRRYGRSDAEVLRQELREFIPGKTTKKSFGTGFGLPIARRNIKSHGGSIGIQSQDEAGTTVTIVLPTSYNGGNDDAQGTCG